jgi:hypothetical protein
MSIHYRNCLTHAYGYLSQKPDLSGLYPFSALMSDAFHLLSDVASFIVALAAIYFAEKPATRRK